MQLRLKIANKNNDKLILPVNYNNLLQAFIYNNINLKLAEFLHTEGFVINSRIYKLFAFSKLMGYYEFIKTNKTIIFSPDAEIVISSPINEFYNEIGQLIVKSKELYLGNQEIELKEINIKDIKVENETIKFKTLSPIVAYSTLYKADGKKRTCYYHPGDADYDEIITNNLKKKYEAFYQLQPPERMVQIKPLGNMRMRKSFYKGIEIRGYEGRIKVTGPVALLQMGVDAGFGSKNAQGYGCVEVMK